MKNVLFSLGLGLIPMLASGQNPTESQLPNSKFQQFEDDAANTVGKRPVKWSASNVNQMIKKQLVFDASASGEGVKMQNDFVGMLGIGANAPAYITLGKTWNYVKGMDPKTGDGGTYGGVSFTYMPDAVKVSYKRVLGNEKPQEQAKFIVYSWKGHTSATGKWKGNMQDREKDVLGMVSPDVTVTKTSDFALVCQAEYSVPAKTMNQFETVEFPLKYVEGKSRPEYLNVILSSADYYSRANIGKGNVLYVKNIELVYRHALRSFTLNGTKHEVTSGVTEFDLTAESYDPTKITFEKDGIGAEVKTSFNQLDGILTVEVQGNDYKVNPQSRTAYTLRFAKPVASASLAGVKIGGVELQGFASDKTAYTLPYPYFPGVVIEGTPAEGSRMLSVSEGAWFEGQTSFFNPKEQTVTLKVANAKDEVTDYVFRFTPAVDAPESGVYNGAFNLVLVTADDQRSRGPLVSNEKIALSRNTDGTVNLSLQNFQFMGGTVGDIFLPHARLDGKQISGTGRIRLTAFNPDGTVNTGALGWTLGVLPLDVKVTLYPEAGKGILQAAIDIDMSQTMMGGVFKNIHVDLLPYQIESSEMHTAEDGFGLNYYDHLKAKGYVTKETASYLQVNNTYMNNNGEQIDNPMVYLDLSEAVLADNVTYTDLMQGAPKVNNTLVYVRPDTKLDGKNLIKGSIAKDFVLNDGAPFSAPKAFTAESVVYNRMFNATAGVKESVILPFSVSSAELSGHLYEFKGVENGSALFEEVETGVQAQTPYMVDAASESLFEGLSLVEVPATSSHIFEQVKGENAHVGVFSQVQLESTGDKTYYICNKDGFIKTSGEILPAFRTALSTTSVQAPAQLKVVYKQIETGITEVDTIDESVKDGVYDLRGIRVAEKFGPSLPAGVYIVNGKKTVVK